MRLPAGEVDHRPAAELEGRDPIGDRLLGIRQRLAEDRAQPLEHGPDGVGLGGDVGVDGSSGRP